MSDGTRKCGARINRAQEALAAERENTARLLLVIAELREATGVGVKPMLTELVEAVREKVKGLEAELAAGRLIIEGDLISRGGTIYVTPGTSLTVEGSVVVKKHAMLAVPLPELERDELARLRRLAAALDDDGLAQKAVSDARNTPTKYPELQAITAYRQALREAAKGAPDE